MANKRISAIVLGVLFASCSGSMDESSYIQWVRDYDNGLHAERQMGDYIFDVQYLPADYRWLQYKDQQHEDDGLQYYMLTIRPKHEGQDLIEFGVMNEVDKQRKLYYFSYTFQNDITMEENGKVLPCLMYHFERPADMKDSRTFMLAFEKTVEPSEETKLSISSSVLGSLPVNIKISKNNIPALAL